MLFRKLSAGIILAAMLLLSACAAPNGIMVLENLNGTGFTMDLTQFNAETKWGMSLTGGDVLQVEVTRDSGKIALAVNGKNGSEPYTGNDLESGIFTITVSEADEYVFRITGKDATGKILVKNLGSGVK
ncbi:hypothetical protein [Dehalobacterium formicoaceticum]|uniref:Lipoprotein n=1 Tax=Dehalobacterium formicoaceticum TaxID=51515 RepID=A0ABT1Y7V4_9FIRM|nr:hypothetical protein [Dehalobacterium formicoaceticum]MCR6545756.1 hypothetical protein [Dehalobacterium formicoaceticum]